MDASTLDSILKKLEFFSTSGGGQWQSGGGGVGSGSGDLIQKLDELITALKPSQGGEFKSAYGFGANSTFGRAEQAVTKTGKDASGGSGSGVGDALIGTGNPYAMAAGAVLKFGEQVVNGVDKLRKWGDQLHESNMKFAEFGGTMAEVAADQQVREFELGMIQGERRSQSARELAESKSRLDRQMAPIEDFWANLKNKFATGMNNVLAGLAKLLGVKADEDTNADTGRNDVVSTLEWSASNARIERDAMERRPRGMR